MVIKRLGSGKMPVEADHVVLYAIMLGWIKTLTIYSSQALKSNAKIEYYPDEEQFLFRPALGLKVRNRRQLLERLREYEREGLGGIPKSEVAEALPNPEKAIKVCACVCSVSLQARKGESFPLKEIDYIYNILGRILFVPTSSTSC